MRSFSDTQFCTVLIYILISFCTPTSDAELAPLAKPYYLLTLKVKNYINPVLEYEELEPYFTSEDFYAHYWGDHIVYQRAMNKALNEWKDEVSGSS